MEETRKQCSIMPINGEAATRPDKKARIIARIIRMPQRPVLYFFNIG